MWLIVVGIILVIYLAGRKDQIIQNTVEKKFDTAPVIPKPSTFPERKHLEVQRKYFELTGVDIEAEKRKWDERGKGYYGEYKVFERLFYELPGCCKFLMNLQVPIRNGKTTEIDFLMVHETGIYVFEIKHYKGDIYGKDEEPTWTQYFRTTHNNPFNNPIRQNDYHIHALKDVLIQNGFIGTAAERMSELPIHSVVVFTNEEVKLHLQNSRRDVIISTLAGLVPLLKQHVQGKQIWDVNAIDQIWTFLSRYAPICEAKIPDDNGEEAPLYKYVNALKSSVMKQEQAICDFEKQWNAEIDRAISEYRQEVVTAKEQLQESYQKQEITLKRRTKLRQRVAAILCVLFVVLSVLYCIGKKDQYKEEMLQAQAEAKKEVDAARAELEEFKGKWQPVGEFVVDSTMIKKDFILVEGFKLQDSKDLKDVVSLSCVLRYNGTDYYAVLDKNTKYAVVLQNGMVYEYSVFSNQYMSYSLGSANTNLTAEISDVTFSGFSAADISYIKLTGLRICRKNVYYNNTVISDFEIELYSAKE